MISRDFIGKSEKVYPSHLTMSLTDPVKEWGRLSIPMFRCHLGLRLHIPVVGTSSQNPASCYLWQLSLPCPSVSDYEAARLCEHKWWEEVRGTPVFSVKLLGLFPTG